jgi:voltage-gated potassium channel
MPRLMEWLLQRRFRVLLAAFGLLLIAYPLLNQALEGRLLFDALVGILFLAALLVIFRHGRHRLVGSILGGFLIVGLWTGYVLPGIPHLPVSCAFHVVAPVFLGFTLASILQTVHADVKVSADSIYGAFCGYLLIGLAFGHLYCLVAILTPNSFNGTSDFARQIQIDDRQHFVLTYFSFTTLTSLGYGDITPASDVARSLAVLESLFGQFYIAILIGELIGKKVSHTIVDQRDNSRGNEPSSSAKNP